MKSAKIFFVICIACILASPLFSIAHHEQVMEVTKRKLPPVIDPGPKAALLIVKVTDRATGKQTSATACVNQGAQEPDDDPYARYSLRRSAARLRGPIRFRKLDPYFYTDGRFEVRVPPGRATIEFGKGYEYIPCKLSLDVSPHDTVEVEAALDRWIDMAQMGWFSGDPHIHMVRTESNDDTLLAVTSAKDIRYSFLFSYNTEGYEMGKKYERCPQGRGLGDVSEARAGDYYLSSGQEYRAWTLGHVNLYLIGEYVPGVGPVAHTDSGPSMAVIADQAHAQDGFICLDHGGYYNQEADGLMLAGKLDFFELFQFGMYTNVGLDGWYDFLNIGYRQPISGASDYFASRELASEMTYAWCDRTPTPRQYLEALAQGKSFVTSGPMIFLDVEGRKPGEVITFGQEVDTTLDVSVRVASENYPVRYLELIANGRVVVREYSDKPKTRWHLQHRLRVRESSWIAARAYADAGTDSHTNPVYVYLGGKLPFNRDSARQIMLRLDGSLETIENRDVLDRLRALRKELVNLLDGRKSSLPLPSVP
jgi:hypothetical protein